MNLCIIVPYRDRELHLAEFLPHIEKTLNDQRIENHVIIVEQENGKPFNRAKLLNVGFHYTNGSYDNYCFHDVDMLPIESDYSYCPNPTHLAARAEQFNWNLPYAGYFGGVTMFDRESFLKVNGYANEYWGWGAEDDDMFKRCVTKGLKISRKNCSFKSLSHARNIDHREYDSNVTKLRNFENTLESNGDIIEGLSTLDYDVLHVDKKDVWTKITVKI